MKLLITLTANSGKLYYIEHEDEDVQTLEQAALALSMLFSSGTFVRAVDSSGEDFYIQVSNIEGFTIHETGGNFKNRKQ